MFNVGDLIIYSAQGICHIDDICEKTYEGVTRNYYILHPLDNCKLKISVPVDNDKVTMMELIDRNKAEKILESFKLPGIDWIELSSQRNQIYSDIVKQGNRLEIARIINTLMRKKQKAVVNKRNLNTKDNNLLSLVQNILFSEVAMSLDTTYEVINEKINCLINEYDY